MMEDDAIVMWLMVEGNGSETISLYKPVGRYYPRLRLETVSWVLDNEEGYWKLDNNGDHDETITAPKGTIEKLLGRKLTWEDEPVGWRGDRLKMLDVRELGFLGRYLKPVLSEMGLIEAFFKFMYGQTIARYEDDNIYYWRDVHMFCNQNKIDYKKLEADYKKWKSHK